MTRKTCAVADCDSILSEHATSNYCSKCRSSFGYWWKKSPAARLQRSANLKLYGNRLEEMRETNVVAFRRRA